MAKLQHFYKNGLANVLFSVLCAAALTCVSPLCALAEDEGEGPGDSSSNYVDERQIPDGSFLYETSIEALANADLFYDNSTVVVTGEVVGDRINGRVGSDSCWITLYSLRKGSADTYAPASIQVCVSNSLADTIDTYGKYNVRGTYVQVNGVFHLACPEHEGLSDVHADSLSVVQKGMEMNDQFDFLAFLPGIIAVGAGLLVMFVHKRMKERAR